MQQNNHEPTQALKPYRVNEGRREVYAEYGYRTLIIWESETKRETAKLEKKIIAFVSRRGDNL